MPNSTRHILPSNYYPDYFKMELGIGGANAHPITAVLDETFFQWFLLSHQQAYSLHPNFSDEERQSDVLQMYGFRLGALNKKETTRLFDLMPALFQSRGTIACLEQLANLYFGKSTVTRGRPGNRDRMKSRSCFPLRVCEPEDSDRLLFVSLDKQTTEARQSEFLVNARRLLPEGYRVVVAPPLKQVEIEKTTIDLSGPIRVERRRL